MLANRLLGWSGDVEDVVQDVFLSVFVGRKKFSHAPYFTGKRDSLQQFALFFPTRLDILRLSGTIDLQIGIIVGGKEYVLQKSIFCHFISPVCLYR